MVLGLVVAFSALWLTLFYPRQENTGDLLYLFRLLAASGLGASILLGFTAIRNREVARHRAWMIRAYALALGAGTQVFTQGIGEAVFGAGAIRTDLMLGSAWVINLAVAEWVIHACGGSPSTYRSSVGGVPMSPRPHAPDHYEFRIDGHLDDHWSVWLDDLTLTHEADGTTTLRGAGIDQAKLHGLLTKLRDLGATLISVEAIDRPDP